MQSQGNLPGAGRLDYLDLELEIGHGTAGNYPVSVARSPAGEARDTMRLPYDGEALENHLKDLTIALLRSVGSRRQLPSPEERAVQEFGRDLFETLFTVEIRSRYDVSNREADRQGKGLRLKLKILPPELARLPWEFLYDPRQGEYICLSRHNPIVRYLDLPQPIQPLIVAPPLCILGLVASPSDLPPLDMRREKERIETALQNLQEKGLVKLTWMEGQSWRDLQRVMRGGPWHIFHFVGHGGFDPVADEGLIALADDTGCMHPLRATELARLIADQHSLRLALLNSCESARGSQLDIFSSTASILVRRGMPAVVAMQYEISDLAAIEFSRTFYEALAEGLPVDAATTEARKAISLALPNTAEWGTPVLYMREPQGVIFELPATGLGRPADDKDTAALAAAAKKQKEEEQSERERSNKVAELYREAEASHAQSRFGEAREMLEDLLELDPGNAAALGLRARVAAAQAEQAKREEERARDQRRIVTRPTPGVPRLAWLLGLLALIVFGVCYILNSIVANGWPVRFSSAALPATLIPGQLTRTSLPATVPAVPPTAAPAIIPSVTPASEPTSTAAPLPATPTAGAIPVGGGSGRMAFQSDRDGTYQIYLMNADGSGQTRLTNASDNQEAAWSPDGRRIAFLSRRDGQLEIYVMNADGSEQTRLTTSPPNSSISRAVWSPDGKRIAFGSNRDGRWRIYAMNADGSGLMPVSDVPDNSMNPAWSPDGAKISFQAGGIYTTKADGSGQTLLPSKPMDKDVAWSPDGKKIAYACVQDHFWQICVMNPDGSGQTRLTNRAADDQFPTWSPNGGKIEFFSEATGGCDLFVMNSDGSAQTRLGGCIGRDDNAAWSPDGKWIAYTADLQGKDALYIMNADGQAKSNLAANGSKSDWQPAEK